MYRWFFYRITQCLSRRVFVNYLLGSYEARGATVRDLERLGATHIVCDLFSQTPITFRMTRRLTDQEKQNLGADEQDRIEALNKYFRALRQTR